MDYELSAAFTRVLQEASGVGGNSYLPLLRLQLEDIDACQSTELLSSKERLRDMLADHNMGLDGRASREFIEELGEAHFHVVAMRRGFNLVKIPRKKGEKTPDFRHPGPPTVFFEVKTPSVVHGEYGMQTAIEDAWDGRVNQQHQLDSGRRVAFAELVVAPYGGARHEERVTRVIQVLQDKIRNNLKQDQFSKGPTYLVCCLLLLHPYGRTDGGLSPVYPSAAATGYSAPVTGHLWMTAFSQPGMLVHSEPEFEGAPGIEGTLDQPGILVGDDYDFVEGIIFVIYTLEGYSRMVCLVRSDDQLNETAIALVGSSWNDRYDSNGWQLSKLAAETNSR